MARAEYDLSVLLGLGLALAVLFALMVIEVGCAAPSAQPALLTIENGGIDVPVSANSARVDHDGAVILERK